MDVATIPAALDPTALDRLEQRLAIRANQIAAEPTRARKGVARDTPAPHEAPQAIAQDILQTYRGGVTVAPQAESRPLIPLFAAAGTPVPPAMQVDHAQLRYDFYSVEIVFSVLLPPDQYPSRAEFGLHLSDKITDAARRTRAIQLFPGRKDISLFTVNVEGGIGIDAGMQLTLPMTPTGLPISFDKFSAEAKLKAGIVVGPFSYPIRRAAIEVTGEQSADMFWRYDMDSELSGANTFKSVLILKVAQEAGDVFLDAQLAVTPYKASWLVFKELLPPLAAQARMAVELARG